MPAEGLAGLAGPALHATSSLAWTAAALAWILAVPLWYVTKFVSVIPHEGGHALVAKLLFQKLDSIRFEKNGGGATNLAKDPPWLFAIFIGLAGYLGPSLFGLLAAEVVIRGGTGIVLWGSLGFLLIMLIAVRGPVGWVAVPSLMIIIGFILMKVPPPHQVLITYVWVWFLLIAPVEHMFFFLRNGIYHSSGSDSAKLEQLTRFPSPLWGLVFLVGTVTALVYGGALLLGRPLGG